MKMNNRVVITGMGVVSPIGNTIESYWDSLKEGVCGIKTLPEELQLEGIKVQVAGTVTDFSPEPYLDKREAKRVARFSQFAIYASKKALEMAQLDMEKEDANKVGVIVGRRIGALDIIEEEPLSFMRKGREEFHHYLSLWQLQIWQLVMFLCILVQKAYVVR